MANLESAKGLGGGRVSLLAYNLWAWPYLATHTSARFALALARSAVADPADAFAVEASRWARWNLILGRFRLDVDGAPPEGGAILVSNHLSYFDIAVVLALVPPPVRFVARTAILGIPVIGAVLRRGGHIVVDRESSGRNEEALERAAALARTGCRISFFPEGTRSRDGRIGPFRSGAFRVAAEAGVPVIPLVLAGTRGAFERMPSPIRPSIMAARFLLPRTVTMEEATDPVWREALREEMSRAFEEIAPGTGPRL